MTKLLDIPGAVMPGPTVATVWTETGLARIDGKPLTRADRTAEERADTLRRAIRAGAAVHYSSGAYARGLIDDGSFIPFDYRQAVTPVYRMVRW